MVQPNQTNNGGQKNRREDKWKCRNLNMKYAVSKIRNELSPGSGWRLAREWECRQEFSRCSRAKSWRERRKKSRNHVVPPVNCGFVLFEEVIGRVSVGLAVTLQPFLPHYMRMIGPKEEKYSMREQVPSGICWAARRSNR